jgi:hypothetical protein
MIVAKKSKSKGCGNKVFAIIAIAAIIIFAFVLAYLLMKGIGAPGYNTGIFAVINDTTNEIVWVGGGSLCIPAANNTRLVPDCMKVGNLTGYSCNGTYYGMSVVQIDCGGVVKDNPN